MLVIVIGSAEIPRPIAWEMDEEECSSFDRLKTAINTGINKYSRTMKGRNDFENFIICGEQTIINRETMKEVPKCSSLVVIAAKQIHLDHCRKKIDRPAIDWDDRHKTIKNRFLSEEFELELANTGFINPYPTSKNRIVTCTTCMVDQDIVDDYIPILDQHAYVNPYCSKLRLLGHEMTNMGGNISLWIKELANITRRCYSFERSWASLIKRTRLPDKDTIYEKADLRCIVCREDQPTILNLPCAHLNLCVKCYKAQIQIKQTDRKRCEVCKEIIKISCKILN